MYGCGGGDWGGRDLARDVKGQHKKGARGTEKGGVGLECSTTLATKGRGSREGEARWEEGPHTGRGILRKDSPRGRRAGASAGLGGEG